MPDIHQENVETGSSEKREAKLAKAVAAFHDIQTKIAEAEEKKDDEKSWDYSGQFEDRDKYNNEKGVHLTVAQFIELPEGARLREYIEKRRAVVEDQIDKLNVLYANRDKLAREIHDLLPIIDPEEFKQDSWIFRGDQVADLDIQYNEDGSFRIPDHKGYTYSESHRHFAGPSYAEVVAGDIQAASRHAHFGWGGSMNDAPHPDGIVIVCRWPMPGTAPYDVEHEEGAVVISIKALKRIKNFRLYRPLPVNDLIEK